jgi:tetratricopeptide (TPR) repeat protein
MQSGQTPNENESLLQRRWIIIFCACLLALSILWSVDKSIVYFLSAGAAFSLFKILGSSKKNQSGRSNFQYEKMYETYRPSQVWIFWQDVKEIFRKDSSGPRTPQQAKVFVTLVAGFIGFIFFISILSAIFGGDDSSESNDYYERALTYYNNQQYDSAAYYYKFAIENDPENPDLFLERGNAFLNANNTDSALVMYDNALALNPSYAQAQYSKGYIYFNQKNYRQAIDETKKIMEYAPDYTDAMLIIGDSFYNQSQLDSALRWYEGAYNLGYRSAVLCHLMAYINDTKGETNRAIFLYREAIGQDSTIVDIYKRLGELVPGDDGNWYRTKAAQMSSN